MNPDPAENSVVVGRFLGPWGVKGWLQIYSYTVPREGIFDYAQWLIGGASEPIPRPECKISGKRLVVKLPGVDTPETAALWTDKDIRVSRDQLPPLPVGEYYWHDLVGLLVLNREGVRLGNVKQMLSTGAHDVMEITPESEGQNVLIPFVFGEYIDEVNLAEELIRAHWPIEWLDL